MALFSAALFLRRITFHQMFCRTAVSIYRIFLFLLPSHNVPNQTKPTKPNLANQTKPAIPNLPDQTYQTKPTKPNLSSHTYQTKQTCQTYHKLTEPNLPNQTKLKLQFKAVNALVHSAFGNVFNLFIKGWFGVHGPSSAKTFSRYIASVFHFETL